MSPYIYLLITIMINEYTEQIAVSVDQNELPIDCVLHWREPENNKALFDLVSQYSNGHAERVMAVTEIRGIVSK
jgi:hypothetical protein